MAHGLNISVGSVLPPPVAVLGAGVIGVVGTADDADVDGDFGREVTLEASEFSSVATQALLDALTSTHWAVLTISSVKYLAFKSPSGDDELRLRDLKSGNKVDVYASAGTSVLMTFTIGDDYDATNKRIQINASADVSSLTDGTNYDLKTNEIVYNDPFLLRSRADAPSDELGDDGTLPDVLNGIYQQGNVPVQMVIVETGVAVAAITAQDLAVATFSTFTVQSAYDAAGLTGAHWALIHEGNHRFLAFQNLATADIAILQGLAIGRQITVEPSGGGTVLKTYTIEGAYDSTHERIEVNMDANTTTLTTSTDYDLQTLAVAAVTAASQERIHLLGRESQATGIYALLSASPSPTILCLGSTAANTRPGTLANVLASGLVEIAGKLNAIAVLDGPNTTHAEAITFAGDFDSARAYLVDPGVVTADGDGLASPSVAGKMAATPFWESPSNMILNGVVGMGRLVDKDRAQALNDAYIATIRRLSGYRLWGNETVTTTNPNFRFVSVQRTADAIEASLQAAHLWAVDQNITRNYFQQVAQSVQNFLDGLQSQVAIAGGRCYPDAAKNTKSAVQAGRAFFQVEWSALYPAQEVNISIELNDNFLENVIGDL